MTVDLLLHVSRDADNRLSGTVAINGGADVRDFSGTLELMRVFEELVPVAASGGDPTGLATSVRGQSGA